MKRILKSRCIRLLAYILVLATATLGMPVEAMVFPPKSPYEQKKPLTIEDLRRLTDRSGTLAKRNRTVAPRELSAQEMARLYGRGVHRNQYLCGTMPWQRSFHDVNVATGNLFKSCTDIQIAPGRGAGLVLQRTYNSNDNPSDTNLLPFGRGWTHAYDIRMQEASTIDEDPVVGNDGSAVDTMDSAVRTDFFKGEHIYKRDADGLYTPPAYTHDLLTSDYGAPTEPASVKYDSQTSLDGTQKHFFSNGGERACDYIIDKYNRKTTLTYGKEVTVGGVTKKLLTQVKDPTDRTLTFSWSEMDHPGSGIWRVTSVVANAPNGDEIERVDYEYYASGAAGSGGESYPLWKVHLDPVHLRPLHLDPTGLDRVTTYTYTAVDGENGETGLLSGIEGPQGNVVAYDYEVAMDTDTVCVCQITEPAGVGANGLRPPLTWTLDFGAGYWSGGRSCSVYCSGQSGYPINGIVCGSDWSTRVAWIYEPDEPSGLSFWWAYDSDNNVVFFHHPVRGAINESNGVDQGAAFVADCYTYGLNGNVITHFMGNIRPEENGNSGISVDGTGINAGHNCGIDYAFPEVDEYRYYDEDKYFQKKMVIRWKSRAYMDGNHAEILAGNSTDQDLIDHGLPRSQGIVVSSYDYDSNGGMTVARDADYPRTGRNFAYTYTDGQKTSETNLNGIVTSYTYGDSYGNLTMVVQDPSQAGHVGLNRTTQMTYDDAGRVTGRVDPNGQTSTVTYNAVGQPLTASFPDSISGVAGETIEYNYCGKDGEAEDPLRLHNGGNGRLLNVQTKQGTVVKSEVAMDYEDGCDRVASVCETMAGKGSRSIFYTYTPLGSLASKALPNGSYWEYEYSQGMASPLFLNDSGELDSLHERLDHVDYHDYRDSSTAPGRVMLKDLGNDYGTVKFNIQKDVNDNEISYCVAKRYFEPVRSDYLDSSRARVVKVSNTLYCKDGNGEFQPQLLTQNDYTYDDLTGNRLSNKIFINGKGTRTERYTYDVLNRLTKVDYGNGTVQNYKFDEMGDRLSDLTGGTQNYAYDAANRLTQRDSAVQNYFNDANGNTTQSPTRQNTWDSQNRLVQCVGTVNGVTKTSTFTYGADGLRRSMTVAGNTTDYLLDGQNVVQEFSESTSYGTTTLSPTATYLAGPRGVEYRQDENTQKRSWYLYDGLGSVIGEIDEGNQDQGTPPQITATRTYDVYGAPLAGSDEGTTRHKFCGGLGHTADADTGLTYMRARYYDPAIGRFISEDPAQSGANWYCYASNNPTRGADGSGRSTEQIDWLIRHFEGIVSGILAAVFFAPVQDKFTNPVVKPLRRLAGAGLQALGNYLERISDEMITNGYAQMQAGSEELAVGMLGEGAGGDAASASGARDSYLGAQNVAMGMTLHYLAMAAKWMGDTVSEAGM